MDITTEVGAVRIALLQCPTDVPGHPVDIRVEQAIAILSDMVHLCTGGRAQLPRLRLLVAGHGEGLLEADFGLGHGRDSLP
jgi:hypothetical protein